MVVKRRGDALVFLGIVLGLLHGRAHAQAPARLGVSLGSTHFIGVDYETRTADRAVQYSVGLVELAGSGALTYKKYRRLGSKTLFYGGGYWGVLAVTKNEAGLLSLARATAGIEWKVKNKATMGVELAANIPVYLLSLWGPERTINTYLVFPTPGLYYRWDY